ncbi:phenylalanine--tRNA ligase subunit beta [Hyperthermus butylicus]|uniref:phenylalanine--tRNA ligase n=1 Tax=Hyperthermus butylicus (strain DSM 5456 / JCM 9403 / PLM1-5) TaxID=415426 RepID=A2BL76_HYPBU|nr:phenylalanine--tRNA ligase subunit beta [Hyperthermus butylicus]ABM80737.1 Phenylalanyl-tRNA synthetase beta chain [Hyperthermus butylicus DSM 5456]
MPVLRFKPGRVEEVIGVQLDQALKLMERLKIEVEIDEEGYVVAELEVDRPDMYSLEGIGRQVKGLLGVERGLPRYNIVETDYRIVADDVPTRPYVLGAIVWDVDVDEDFLEELIQFQEKLHVSHGDKRRRVAIGLHDLDKLPGKTIHYKFEHVDMVRFTPLHGDREMSLREVFNETPQGREYSGIALQGDRHPVLYANGEVISVPPVINAELTKVEPGTRHLFIDVTGPELGIVEDILAILATNLAERSRTKRIGLVRVEAPWGNRVVPGLEPHRWRLRLATVERVIGLKLSANEVAQKLEAMRFGVVEVGGDYVDVLVPRFRIDIMHEVDLAEEVALAIGFDALKPEKPKLMLRGGLLPVRAWEREARKLLAGHGYVEVKTYTLVSCREQEAVGGIPAEKLVKIANPVSVEADCVRATMLPNLLRIAASNQHRIPLRIFELGEVVEVTGEGDRGVRYGRKLAILYMADKAGYEDIQAVVYSIVRLTNDEISVIKEYTHPLLIQGRTALAKTKRGLRIIIGEVRPEILERYGIAYPIAVAEIDYTALAGGAAVPRP